GIGAYFILSNVDVEHFSEKWGLFFVFNLGFIALLWKFGVGGETTGNQAWLAIPHFPVQIQPAEVVKLS
ncbi:cell division protein FtsW, partial [Klebsiella oxytoca]